MLPFFRKIPSIDMSEAKSQLVMWVEHPSLLDTELTHLLHGRNDIVHKLWNP
jgi:hypothetical protein